MFYENWIKIKKKECDNMLISKKLDNFMEELQENCQNVDIRVDLDLEYEFNNYTIVVNKRQNDKKRYVLKVYDKHHMSSIGEYCYKYFKTQNDIINEIMKKVVE